jgi:hypothetical protein
VRGQVRVWMRWELDEYIPFEYMVLRYVRCSPHVRGRSLVLDNSTCRAIIIL